MSVIPEPRSAAPGVRAPDWVPIYTPDAESLRLERTGSHSDLFKKRQRPSGHRPDVEVVSVATRGRDLADASGWRSDGSGFLGPPERFRVKHNTGLGGQRRTDASTRGAAGHRGNGRRKAAQGGVNAPGYLVRDLTVQAEDVADLPVVAPCPKMLV